MATVAQLDHLQQWALDRARSLRRRAGSAAVDTFFYGATYAARLHPAAQAARWGVRWEREIPYTAEGDPDHRLDIYTPPGRGPWPVVMYLHGGAFRILNKDSHRAMALMYARRGFLVFNVNYRLAPRHRYPAAHADAAAALAWVFEQAALRGGDLSRLVLAGESAGANLAASLTLACCYPRPEPWVRRVWSAGVVPRAAVPACGAFQITAPERHATSELPFWIKDRVTAMAVAYLGEPLPAPGSCDLADPVLILERGEAPARPLPPFFLSVGTGDLLLEDTKRMKTALDRLGVVAEARYYPDQPHAFQALLWREQAQRSWEDTFAFLDRHLGSGGTVRGRRPGG